MCTYRRITIDEERLMLAFETLDLENTGFLTKDTIRKALGEHMTEDELNEMVSHAIPQQLTQNRFKKLISMAMDRSTTWSLSSTTFYLSFP